jgi:hypothetical protein
MVAQLKSFQTQIVARLVAQENQFRHTKYCTFGRTTKISSGTQIAARLFAQVNQFRHTKYCTFGRLTKISSGARSAASFGAQFVVYYVLNLFRYRFVFIAVASPNILFPAACGKVV